MPNLTEKQKRFCREYLLDLNGTQAAIRAGYSEKTADAQASRMLRIVKVQSVLQDLMAERARRVKITTDAVIHGIADMAFGQPHITDSVKLNALKLLGLHLGMFKANGLIPDEKPAENSTDFHQLPYHEQQRLERLAVDTLPTRLNPPVITQGDARPTGLEDKDAPETEISEGDCLIMASD